MADFKLKSPFKPTGDQPQAISALVSGIQKGFNRQTLLGVTGSGKTFTMANVIEKVQRPTLVISHNKTLAAQVAAEFKDFFPDNAVHYFVSYYDYYQPEAYIPQTDTYIEKETAINEEIDRLRNAATMSLLTRSDVIIIASVSCIYGLGNPQDYFDVRLTLETGILAKRRDVLLRLAGLQYERSTTDIHRGSFRVRGDALEIYPSYEETVWRVEFLGDKIDSIVNTHPLTGEKIKKNAEKISRLDIFPAKHFVAVEEKTKQAMKSIEQELHAHVQKLRQANKPLEAERIERRTRFDIEMIKETGYCQGIENYSRHFDRRTVGEPPFTLLDYFAASTKTKQFLTIIDESHITVPQIGGMYEGDRSRKQNLIDYGFRLPSALDNRPLRFEEFKRKIGQTLFTSATPAPYEIQNSQLVVEQLIRPTGLLDPEIEIRKIEHQIDDILNEVSKRTKKHERVLITTLTKRMSEDLSQYLEKAGVKVNYLHSDIETFERLEILRDLRQGVYDVLVGINLLREGLDLPEVSLVIILDADKEGFLRSETSLVQVMGRAARHVNGKVIMYADVMTRSMKAAIKETNRRRAVQAAYNKKHGIKPKTIHKAIREDTWIPRKHAKVVPKIALYKIAQEEIPFLIHDLTNKMNLAAQNLEFETAAELRDQIKELQERTKKEK
ncbi:MAG TPA: excinuclease ABC subunit UvrB [Patescibacteria group bacterium]|nr:excinuclease ABC subunit UvrB [Patescibacteria group bacterium]